MCWDVQPRACVFILVCLLTFCNGVEVAPNSFYYARLRTYLLTHLLITASLTYLLTDLLTYLVTDCMRCNEHRAQIYHVAQLLTYLVFAACSALCNCMSECLPTCCGVLRFTPKYTILQNYVIAVCGVLEITPTHACLLSHYLTAMCCILDPTAIRIFPSRNPKPEDLSPEAQNS
jgi:hypothetical protein